MSDEHSKHLKPPTVLISEIMTAGVHRVHPEMTVSEVVELLTRHQISGAPIVDQMDTVLSVISEGDLLRIAVARGLDATIASVLDLLPKAHRLITVEKHNTFTDAYRLFIKHTLHRIVVIDSNGRLHGLVTRADILRMFVEAKYGKKIKRPAA